MSADYPAAQEHFVPRNFMFSTNGHKAVVIHKTGGDATPADVYHTFINSGNPGKSVHYAIGQDGSIWQFVPEALGAGGNGITDGTMEAFWQPYVNAYGNLNECTLSIEHCDPSPRNDTPLTAAQKQASFALVAHLCQKYGISADHIKPHHSICATACPGTYPMAELVNFIAQGGTSMGNIPAGWTYINGVLTAPNGHKVVLGFCEHVLNYPGGWDPANVPLGEEYAANPVQLHRPDLGPGQRQGFRDGWLWFTTAMGVIQEAFSGLEIQACYDAIAKASQPAPTPINPDVAIQLNAAITAIQKALTELK